jgi:hypothetical protein
VLLTQRPRPIVVLLKDRLSRLPCSRSTAAPSQPPPSAPAASTPSSWSPRPQTPVTINTMAKPKITRNSFSPFNTYRRTSSRSITKHSLPSSHPHSACREYLSGSLSGTRGSASRSDSVRASPCQASGSSYSGTRGPLNTDSRRRLGTRQCFSLATTLSPSRRPPFSPRDSPRSDPVAP